MNIRLLNVVEGIIWLFVAIIATFMAVVVTLVVAAVGAMMLLVRMVNKATRSVFEEVFGGGTNHNQGSREKGVRPTVVEGKVLGRS